MDSKRGFRRVDRGDLPTHNATACGRHASSERGRLSGAEHQHSGQSPKRRRHARKPSGGVDHPLNGQ